MDEKENQGIETTKHYNGFSGIDMFIEEESVNVNDYKINQRSKRIRGLNLFTTKPQAKGNFSLYYSKDIDTLDTEKIYNIKFVCCNEYGDVAMLNILGVQITSISSTKDPNFLLVEFTACKFIPWRTVERRPENG